MIVATHFDARIQNDWSTRQLFPLCEKHGSAFHTLIHHSTLKSAWNVTKSHYHLSISPIISQVIYSTYTASERSLLYAALMQIYILCNRGWRITEPVMESMLLTSHITCSLFLVIDAVSIVVFRCIQSKSITNVSTVQVHMRNSITLRTNMPSTFTHEYFIFMIIT